MKQANSRPAAYFDKPSMNIHKLLDGAGVSITESKNDLDPEAPKGSIASVADDKQSVVYIKNESWSPLVQTTTSLPASRIHDIYLDLPEWIATYYTGSDYLNEIEGVEEPWLYNENPIDLGVSLEAGDEINLYIQDKLVKTYWVYSLNLSELIGGAFEEANEKVELLIALPTQVKTLVNDPVLLLLLCLILGLLGSSGTSGSIGPESDLMSMLSTLRMPMIIEGRGVGDNDLPAQLAFLPWELDLDYDNWRDDYYLLNTKGLKATEWIEGYYTYNGSYRTQLSNFCTIRAAYKSDTGTTSWGTIPTTESFQGFPYRVTFESMDSHLTYHKNYLDIEKDRCTPVLGTNIHAEDFIGILDRLTELEQLVKTE